MGLTLSTVLFPLTVIRSTIHSQSLKVVCHLCTRSSFSCFVHRTDHVFFWYDHCSLSLTFISLPLLSTEHRLYKSTFDRQLQQQHHHQPWQLVCHRLHCVAVKSSVIELADSEGDCSEGKVTSARQPTKPNNQRVTQQSLSPSPLTA